jgi:hypothetical protein
VNIFVVAVEAFVFQEVDGTISTGSLWLMAGINWVVFFGAIVLMANLLGQKKLRREGAPTPSSLANMAAEAD